MAAAAGAPCLLIADIDRGGAFAALAGTLALLEPHERAQIRAFAITKFRGDEALLEPGLREMERRLGIPCIGVVPWIDALGIDEEDGYMAPPLMRRWPTMRGRTGDCASQSSNIRTSRTRPISTRSERSRASHCAALRR